MQKLSARQLRLAAALGVAVLILIYSAMGTRGPAPVQTEKTGTRKATRARAEKALVLRAAAPADANFQRYEMIVTRDIFSGRKPPAPKPQDDNDKPPPIKPARPAKPRPAQAAAPKPSPGPPPLTGWSYVGYVVFGGKKLGIMQSDSANTTQDVEVGAQFQGYKVESIEGDEIVLAAKGSRQVLKPSPDFQVAPLAGSVPEARPQRRR